MALAIGAIVLTGCKDEEPELADELAELKAEAKHLEKEAEKLATKIEPEVMAMLAKADALDGATDKGVHKCATCALGMDGKKEHSAETWGYTMHFCTGQCKTAFSKDLKKSILGLKIPKD